MPILLTGKLVENTEVGVIADAKQVAGGYMAITSAERETLKPAMKVTGTIVFETDTSKTYRYNGTDWDEVIITSSEDLSQEYVTKSGDSSIVGNLSINGNLIVSGNTVVSNLENVVTPQNTITLRDGSTTSLIEGEYTGIIAEKYNGNDTGMLVFDKHGTAYVGDAGDVQPLATRDEASSISNGAILTWDAENKKLVDGKIKYAAAKSAGGPASSAEKLTTSAGNASTPVYFSGGVPVACTALKEAYLTWGGKSLSGAISPVSAAMSAEHSANRLAFLNPDALTIEYSMDGGTTWQSSDSWLDSEKVLHVTKSSSITIGLPISANSDKAVTTQDRTRVTLCAQNGTNSYVYTRPRKLLIDASTNNHKMSVLVEYRKGDSETWTTLNTYTLSGWSGWNDIDVSTLTNFGGSKTQTSNIWYIRLTYSITEVSTNDKYKQTPSQIHGIRLFGETSWVATSTLGKTGHLYDYDYAQNATFPASVTARSFVGDLVGNADSATRAQQDSSGNVIATTYVAKADAVGQKLKNYAEVFNDYTNNNTNIPYAHVEGLTNNNVVKGYQLSYVDDDSRKIVTIDLTNSPLVVDGKFDAIRSGDNFFVLYQTPKFADDKITILHPKTDDSSLGLNYKRSRGTVVSVSEIKLENGKTTVDVELSSALKENVADIVNSCTIDDYELIGKMYSNNTDSDNNYVQYKKQDFIDYRTDNERGALGKLIINGGIYGTHDLNFRDLDDELLNVSAHILGVHNKAFIQSFAGGYGSEALGYASFAYGQHCIATGERSFCFGYENIASGNESTVFGANNVASAEYSTAFGYKNTASGIESTAFGRNTVASGKYSTAFGFGNTASGLYSIAMGYGTVASETATFAAGYGTIASGGHSTALGRNTEASGSVSFASGCKTNAVASYSVAMNEGTMSNVRNQTVVGSYNDPSVASALFVVGNGWGESKDENGNVQTIRSNAFVVRTTNFSSGATIEARQQKTFVDVNGSLNVLNKVTTKDVVTDNIKTSEKLTLGSLDITNTTDEKGKKYLAINNIPFLNTTNKILQINNIVTESSILESYGSGASVIGCELKNQGYAGQIALGLYNNNNVWPITNDPTNTWNTLLTVGNGSKNSTTGEIIRSNAFALSRKGEGVFAGDVYVNNSSGSSKKLATEEFVNNVKSDLSKTIQPAINVATQLEGGSLTIGDTTFTETQLKKILKFIESIED